MSILAGVNWSDYSYRNHFQSLRTQILNAEGKEGVSNLYSYLLGSDSDVTALTLAAILLYDIELVPQYEMLIMTHPDKRLRKAFGTFKRKLTAFKAGEISSPMLGTGDFSLAYKKIG
jgi:hypothetical protein